MPATSALYTRPSLWYPKEPMHSRFVQRVVLRNYKSIAACDLQLGALTFLVGPNGSGKSNFLDALRLVADGLVSPLDHAIRERGGIDDVRRRSTGHPHNFGIRLEVLLPETDQKAVYAFEVAAKTNGAFDIKEERCEVYPPPPLLHGGAPSDRAYFVVRRGEVKGSSLAAPPKAANDRLYLVTLSGTEEFRRLYDCLSSMSFYNLSPEQIREVQPPDPGRLLERDGRNLASVLGRLESESPESIEGVRDYLSRIVPDVKHVQRHSVANKETLRFRQQVKGSKYPWNFFASAMSDGTLRALGILTALAQATDLPRQVPLIGIEEPEAALHPAAAGVLFEALADAATRTQVVVTSHSPDLLDHDDIQDSQLLAVSAESGVTSIGPISEVGRSSLRDRLYTAGELLRMSQIEPDLSSSSLEPDQLDLFGSLAP